MTFVKRFSKALLAAVFGLTPAGVVAVLAAFGVHVDVTTIVAVGGFLGPILATLGVAIGPANAPAAPKNPEDHEPPKAVLASWLETPTPDPGHAPTP